MSHLDTDLARQRSASPRICMASKRSFSRQAFQATLYEAEDVLAETSNTDLIELQAGWSFPFRNRWQKSILSRGVMPSFAYVNPGLQKVPLTKDYDIFIAVCQNFWDLPYFNAIDKWKERCKVSVCWLGELWAAEIQACPDLLRSLERFDHVVLSSQGAVGPLSQFVGRKCHLVPTATDTLRFGPYPKVPGRAIDVYSIGRRWEGVHQALLGAASEQNLLYVYDTGRNMAEVQLFDHRQHRDLFGNLAKRTKYFLVSPGKMNLPQETHGQVEVGYRYFEGASAGAVMVGQSADCELFRDLFPWPDPVVEIKPDGSDVLDVIAELESTPERFCEISRRNAVESLQRHDWIHRWLKIFSIAGVEPSAGMMSREVRLKALAQDALRTPVPTSGVNGGGAGGSHCRSEARRLMGVDFSGASQT